MSSLYLGDGDTQSVSPHEMPVLTWQVSSRASPLPAGTGDYRSWLMQRSTKPVVSRVRPDALDVSGTGLQLQQSAPALPASMTSPVTVGSVLGAVFGSSSGKSTPPTSMTPQLPPRHKAHDNVYRSPRPRLVSGLCVPPLGRKLSSGPRLDLSAQPTDLSQSCISRRHCIAARPSSSTLLSHGIDIEGSSSASAEDFGGNCGQTAKWTLSEGFGDECRGVFGPLGMFLVLLVIMFTTHQHQLQLNRVYKYK